MFANNPNGGSLFSSVNTSTPSSTPTQTNNTIQKPQKTEGLFGNLNSGVGVSTPSPSGSLFNINNFNNTNSNSNTQTNGNLFGKTQSINTNGGLFGTSNVSKSMPSSLGQNAVGGSGGGLFGRSSSAGPSTSIPNDNTSKLNKEMGLFGSSNQTSGNLFSGNNATNTTGLFGNQQSLGQQSGSIFSNNVSNFSQPSNVDRASSSNPYGLNIGNVPVSVSSMPASITAASKDKKPLLDRSASSTGSLTSNNTSSGKRAFSVSSTASSNFLPQGPLPATFQSSLINKLSSRLKNAPNVSSTQGIFSPSQNRQWSFNEQGSLGAGNGTDFKRATPNNKDVLPNKGPGSFSFQKVDLSDMRKLKIDPNRSTAKKLKLLSGEATTTKSLQDDGKRPSKTDSVENKNQEKCDTNPTPDKEHAVIEKVPDNKNRSSDEHEQQLPATDISGYWCSPSPEQLLDLPPKKLAAVPNFLIGRKGYGCITFQYDVDLTAFADDLKGELFGNVVVFNPTKTVEVYPDESKKPPIGSGLNVPATITLENVYPVDKKTKVQLKDGSNFDEVQVLVRRLKNIRNMNFVSYNPFGGVWTFEVSHFSIWGLINEEDAEIDEEAMHGAKKEKISKRNFAYPKQARLLAQSNMASRDAIPGGFEALKPDLNKVDPTQNDLLKLQQPSFIELNDELDDLEEAEFLVEEKPYEPDVNEEDFEGLDAEPSFYTSNDWIEQLKLAGSSLKSVYAETANQAVKHATDIDMLFGEFNDNMMLEKKIKKERRLSSYNFARFSSDLSLIAKAPNTQVGARKYLLPSRAHKNLSVMDALFHQHLKVSAIAERTANNYPKVARNSLQFKDVAELCNGANPEYNLWKLCSILFDAINLPYEVEDTTVEALLLNKERHKLICSWIIQQVKIKIDAKIEDTSGALDLIFLHLLKNDVVSASKIAIKSQNGHLAILISLLGSNDPRVRDLAVQQLERWRSCGYKVDPSVSRVYQLLTGNGIDEYSISELGMDDISWLVLLGVNLYYGKIDECSLEELIGSCIKKYSPSHEDFSYVIFKLFCAHNSVETLLREIKETTIVLDCSFLWYFVQILRFNDLGKFSDNVTDKLTFDFIGELRLSQLYKEALFAACFLTDDFTAKQQIDSIIYHEISFFNSTAKESILETLKIPPRLVYEAKALNDRYNNNHLSEANNLINAGAFKEAGKVVVTFVAPRLIINGKLGNPKDLITLRNLLSRFPSSEIETWSSGLGVYNDYLKLKLDSDMSKDLLDSLMSGLGLLFEGNMHHKEIPVCCNIVSQDVATIFLKHHQESLNDEYKEKLLRLPMGQPERWYLKSQWARTA